MSTNSCITKMAQSQMHMILLLATTTNDIREL